MNELPLFKKRSDIDKMIQLAECYSAGPKPLGRLYQKKMVQNYNDLCSKAYEEQLELSFDADERRLWDSTVSDGLF